MTTFESLQLHPNLLKRLTELNFTAPTPIQAAAIPLLLAGKDVVGQAETGSGKTAAFGLPLLQSVDLAQEQVQALVIVPTRELAVQVRQELKQYAQHLQGLKISAFYGGHAFSQERASLVHPPQVLVATPGRLTDHLSRRTLDLRYTKQLILDEADKMLELGFEEQLDKIIAQLPQRQTILFSATMPAPVKQLIKNSLQDPHFVKASQAALPSQVKLVGIRTAQEDKKQTLLSLLQQTGQSGVVVFCNTRDTTDQVAQLLQDSGLSAKPLHGGMEQRDRDKAMTLFRNGTTSILVATDVAARGLDIDALTAIVHFDLPENEEAYQHRSGRTGRAGKSGTVYTLLTKWEEQQVSEWPHVQLAEWLRVEQFRQERNSASKTDTINFATLHINAGRKDKISPKDIVGALIAEAGIKADKIGKIEVQDRTSYVAVPAEESDKIADALNNGKIKGRKFRVGLVK